jgi:AcrR family transcriptional regulator
VSAQRRSPRAPVQARAIRRRESILDATARILDRDGYDALTTNAVAREANTAIGSVYEYFADREALLEALLGRHRARLAASLDAAIAQGGGRPLAIGDRVVDAFARVWKEEPGYRAAWSASQASGLLERTGAVWSEAFTSRVGELVRDLVPSFGKAEARLVALTAVHLVSGLLLAAMSGPPRMERALVAETKTALRAYLASRLAQRAEA